MHGARINFFERLILFDDRPIRPAIEIFFDDDGHRFVFLIAHFDLDVFFNPLRVVIESIVDLPPLTDHIERTAELDLDGFISGRVIDQVFTDEFERLVRAIELGDTNFSGRQRHTQFIFLAVGKSQIDIDFPAGLIADIAVGHR